MDRTALAASGILAPVALALVVGASPAFAASSGSGGVNAFFNNCSEAKAAGQANIPQTQASYREVLDRDRDGIACEADEAAAGTSNGQSGATTGSPSGGGSASIRVNTGSGGSADQIGLAVPAAAGGLGVLVLGTSVLALRRRREATTR